MNDETKDDVARRQVTRREVLIGSAVMAGGAVLMDSGRTEAAVPTKRHRQEAGGRVFTPDGATAKWVERDGVKVFHLRAHEFEREFCPGLVVTCWGWNGLTPGPTIEVEQGDRCRFYVTNDLPEATTVHWHGVLLPSGMDGVGGLNQPPIEPGETFVYEFRFNEAGTFMYHPHYDEMTQMAFGMKGMIVVHPRGGPRVDRDYCLMLHQWRIDPGTRRPDPLADSAFNVLTINGKAFPGTSPLVAQVGERVRIRFGNLSAMEHHPLHLHGHSFEVTETDGGPVPKSARWPETTVLVPVGSVRVVEFVARAPGDWALHCHMTHHIMNQMGHDVPNMVGAKVADVSNAMSKLVNGFHVMGENGMAHMGEMAQKMPHPENSIPMKGMKGPFGYIDMGGMFSIFKVRDSISGYDDPGWYDNPAGTVARKATAAEMLADGIRK